MQADARARLQRALAALADGDRNAFDRVFALAWPVLLSFASRVLGDPDEAEDAAQRAIMKLFAHASRFDPNRDALPWVVTFVANEVRTTVARRRRRPSVPLREELCDHEEPEARWVEEQLLAAIRDVVGTMARPDQIALGMAVDDHDDEPAPATQRKRKQRALTRLRMAWRRIHGLA